MADDADPSVDHFPAIADRAVPDQAATDRALQVREVGFDIDDAGGEHDRACAHRFTRDIHLECLVTEWNDALDTRLAQLRAVELRLLAQSTQQIAARDALGKSGIVVRSRDERGATCISVEHDHAPAKSREIERGGEPGGPAAYDDAVDVQCTPPAATRARSVPPES